MSVEVEHQNQRPGDLLKEPLLSVVFNLNSSEEVQAKIDAADLAVRQAMYEKNLLAHQLEADSRERMRLQAGLKELALQHKRVVRAAMAAEMEASSLRQQAADAAAAASTAQAQAVQAVQAAQQQLALLQAQQQQLLQSQQSILGGQGIMQYPSVDSRASSYISADGKPMLGAQSQLPKTSFSSDHAFGRPPNMLGALGGGGGAQVRHVESNADLTEGLFDHLDGPHGSFSSQAGSIPNLFSPELLSYPFGPGYGSKKRLSTSSAPGAPVPASARRDQGGCTGIAGTAVPITHPPTLNTMGITPQGPASSLQGQAAAAAGAATEAAAAAKGAARAAAGMTAEETQSVRMTPTAATRAATDAAKATVCLAAGAFRDGDGNPTPTTDREEVLTAQLTDPSPTVITPTEVDEPTAAAEGTPTAATEEDTEDTFSTMTVYPEGGSQRMSLDKQTRAATSRPSTPLQSIIGETPELDPTARSPRQSKMEGADGGAVPHMWQSVASPHPGDHRPPTPGRTSMDNALSEVHNAMCHMYRTQSEEPVSRGLPLSPSSQNVTLEPGFPSAPDLGKEAVSMVPPIVLPIVGGGFAFTPGMATPTLGQGGSGAQEEAPSEPLPLREQLLRLSTCNVAGEDNRRAGATSRPSSVYGTSPTPSTNGNALLGVGPGLHKSDPDGQALSASQLLSAQQPAGSAPSHPQQCGLAAELQSAGSLAQGLAGVAGEGTALSAPALSPHLAPRLTDSPFSKCKSFSLYDQHADAGLLSPTRSENVSPVTAFSPSSSLSNTQGFPRMPQAYSAQLLSNRQAPLFGQLHVTRSLQQQPAPGHLPVPSFVNTRMPSPVQHTYQEQPIHGLPPGPALVRRPGSTSLTGKPFHNAAASTSALKTARAVRSGSVSPGAYASHMGGAGGAGGVLEGGFAGRPSQFIHGGAYRTGTHRSVTRSGIATPYSTSALSMSRGRSGIMTPGSSHPLIAAQQTSQSKLDENLHLLQALDKITKERRNEINAELEYCQHEDDALSSQGGLIQPASEALRVKKLQEELQHAKAEASRAEAERAEAVRARHEVAVHFQSVLAQQQRQLPAGQQSQQQEQVAQDDVCAVIADDAMRQRCRDLLTDILGTDSQEQQVPPSYVIAPAAPVAPIHVQQQVNNMQNMLSQMEKVVGRLNESLERDEASRIEKEAMNQRLQALESALLNK